MFLKRKVGVTECPRSLNPSKAIAMAICPVIVHFSTWCARSMHDVACEFARAAVRSKDAHGASLRKRLICEGEVNIGGYLPRRSRGRYLPVFPLLSASNYFSIIFRGMLDIRSFSYALKSKWVKKYLDDNNHANWKLFLTFLLNNMTVNCF